MHTIEIDDETYAALEAVAEAQQASVNSVAARVLSRLRGTGRSLKQPVPVPHGYKMPVSKGERPFTLEDVLEAEDDHDLRGLR